MANFCLIFVFLFPSIIDGNSYRQKNDFENVMHSKYIVGGSESIAPPEDTPIVYITTPDNLAVIQGTKQGQYPDSYYQFYGLRYAEPPVGKYRFQRPKKIKLNGVFKATKPGAPCPQPDPDNAGKVIGSEDCLFLNVFTPRLPSTDELLPVLVWIHGGAFRRGSANQYGGGYLARRDLVVVTIQYRLGSLGFMSVKDKNMPGNVAIFDMATALDWVKEYIHYFGGNSSDIVTIGQGTGGSSATLLGLSNVTSNGLQGIIAMSGTAVSPFAIQHEPVDMTVKLAEKNGCPKSPAFEMIKCLQQLSPEKIISADSWMEDQLLSTTDFANGLGGLLTPAPVVDGVDDDRFLPLALQEPPATSFQNNHVPKIPFFTGVTKHETAGAVVGGGRLNKVLDKIKSIPNYIDQVLVKNIMGFSARNLYPQIEKQVMALTKLSNNYLKLRVPGADPDSVSAIVNQLIEVTSDGIFNVPAVLSSNYWKKNGLTSYFYSFDHVGKLKGLEKINKGSIYFNEDQENTVPAASHGAELPYLFDVRSLEGTPDPVQNESTPLTPEDAKVRDLLTSMIASFAKNKAVSLNGDRAAPYPSFVTILPEPKQEKNFRECQMGLWLGESKNVQNQVCQTLSVLSSKILGGFQGFKNGAGGVVGGITKGTGNLGNKAQSSIGSVFGKLG